MSAAAHHLTLAPAAGRTAVEGLPPAAVEYAVAPAPLTTALDELVLTVTEAANLVVLTTVRGGAPLVADAIDRARMAPIVGTVAGHDTVLAITRSAAAGEVIARYLRSLARAGSSDTHLTVRSTTSEGAAPGAAHGEETR